MRRETLFMATMALGVLLVAGVAFAAIQCPGGDCFGTNDSDTLYGTNDFDYIQGLQR